MSTSPDPAACEIPSAAPQGRYAAEWGLASLLLAGVLTLAGLLMLIILMVYLASIPAMRPGRSDVRLAISITAALSALFCVGTLVGIIAGWIGTRAAWNRCQPGGLPVAGLALSILAFLLWTSVFLAVVMNILDLSRRGVM